MIRLFFVIFVVLGGFAATALWSARGGGVGDVAAEVVPDSLSAVMHSAASLRSAVQSEVKHLRREAAALAPASATGDGLDAKPPAARVAKPEPARAVDSDDEPAAEVRDLVPPAEFASAAGPAAGIPDSAGPQAGDTPEDVFWIGAAPALVPPDPDESAELIRRMLAVYRRSGQLE